MLSKAGFRVTAVDISSEAIRRVKTWANEEKLSIDTKVCLAQEIHSLMDKDFDAVICNSVLDHMTFADASKVMQGIKDVLKLGGIAYLSFDGLEEGGRKEERKSLLSLRMVQENIQKEIARGCYGDFVPMKRSEFYVNAWK